MEPQPMMDDVTVEKMTSMHTLQGHARRQNVSYVANFVYNYDYLVGKKDIQFNRTH